MNAVYEVALGPAAIRVILNVPDKGRLIDSLRTELVDGPNKDKELKFDRYAQIWQDPSTPGGLIYTATPLSCDGYTALHRLMSIGELNRMAEERGRRVADQGVYVLNILPAESAFLRRPR